MPDHPLSTIAKIDPEFMKHLDLTNHLVYTSGALPKKIKLLIAMAFDAAYGAANGVRSLAGAAIAEGATKEEIAEVLRVAYHLSGVGSVYTAAQGLKDIV
jgi:alkylhydroperoxidase/carboxymuconolactone decarboxylase family protein YurZ